MIKAADIKKELELLNSGDYIVDEKSHFIVTDMDMEIDDMSAISLPVKPSVNFPKGVFRIVKRAEYGINLQYDDL